MLEKGKTAKGKVSIRAPARGATIYMAFIFVYS